MVSTASGRDPAFLLGGLAEGRTAKKTNHVTIRRRALTRTMTSGAGGVLPGRHGVQ